MIHDAPTYKSGYFLLEFLVAICLITQLAARSQESGAEVEMFIIAVVRINLPNNCPVQ